MQIFDPKMLGSSLDAPLQIIRVRLRLNPCARFKGAKLPVSLHHSTPTSSTSVILVSMSSLRPLAMISVGLVSLLRLCKIEPKYSIANSTNRPGFECNGQSRVHASQWRRRPTGLHRWHCCCLWNGFVCKTSPQNEAHSILGADLSSFLAVYGAIFDGDLTSYSIGGPVNGLLNLGGLLGAPQGLSGSHNKYEGDVSPTRGDLYQ